MHEGEVQALRQLGNRIEQTNDKVDALMKMQPSTQLQQEPLQPSPTTEADGSDVRSQPTTPRCLESPARTVDLTTPRAEVLRTQEQSGQTEANAQDQPAALRPFKAG